MNFIFFVLFSIIASFSYADTVQPTQGPTVILVDKKTNTLQLTHFEGPDLKVDESFHATLGQVIGDKETEGDLKTPEGIYLIKQRLTPPHLKPKFGSMAFYLDYPNAFDQIAGRTGFDIMLHATNEPERLKKNYDSLGCVVVNNDEIQRIYPKIRVGMTPVLIYSELTADYLTPSKTGVASQLEAFFKGWIRSWESKNIDDYMASYHPDFSAQGKNRDQWKQYKKSLNSKYADIIVGPDHVYYYRHPKYSVITFTQNYHSNFPGGRRAFTSRGTKILYVAEQSGQPKIISENFTNLLWE